MNIEEINAALSKLDHASDSDWTVEGLPNPDVVFALLGNPETIEQAQTAAYIQWAAPEFRRVKPDAEVVEKKTSKSKTAKDAPPPVVDDSVDESVLTDAELVAKEVADAEKVFAEARKKLEAAQREQDKITLEQEKVSKGDPIREYLERQKLNMAAKAEKMQMLRENKDMLREILQVKSPLDNALGSRKRNR